jgi:hypothetical protein
MNQKAQCYIRFFGFPFDESKVAGWGVADPESDWEKFYARKVGVEEPVEIYNDKRFRDDPEFRERWASYWTNLDNIHLSHGCEIGYHSDTRYSGAFVSIVDSQHYIESVHPPKCGEEPVPPIWYSKLEEFCTTIGIPYQEPRWYELMQ